MKRHKALRYVLIILAVIAIKCDCNDDDRPNLDLQEITIDREVQSDNEDLVSPNQLIVRINPEKISEERVNAIKVALDVEMVEPCSCGNPDIDIQRWTIDPTEISIEEAKSTLANEADEEGLRGDSEFLVPADLVSDTQLGNDLSSFAGNALSGSEFAGNALFDFSSLLLPQNEQESVNIAILDTGLDVQKLGESSPFLYNTKGLANCPDSNSGWDFIAESADDNIFDDQGHGTNIAKIIVDRLRDSVPFSILPVRAFNKDGQSSYWHIVCAMAYLDDIQQKKGDLHIINASFGYKRRPIEKLTVNGGGGRKLCVPNPFLKKLLKV